MSEQQMDELARDLDRELTSRDASRRLAVVKQRFDISSLSTVSPREAELASIQAS